MDHAAVEARREKILPGDLLQGIFPPPITLIYPPSSPDATCWTLSNYFRARNFARFIECLLSIRSPETSIPSSKRIRNNEISSTWFLARKREKEILLYILFSKMRASIASLSLFVQFAQNLNDSCFLRGATSIHFKTGTASSRGRSMPASTINPFIAYSCLV